MKFQGQKQLQRDLESYTDKKTIHEMIKKIAEKELINAMIGSAKAGLGPNSQQYKAYSKSYADMIKKAGGQKSWLRSIGRTGRSGGMLDPKNFRIEVHADGKASMVWDGSEDYAEYHQEGDGKIPQRKFVHFENHRNFEALMAAYRAALDKMTAQFNTGAKVG